METIMNLKGLSDRELSAVCKEVEEAWKLEEDKIMKKSYIELMHELDDEVRIRSKSRRICILKDLGFDHLIRQ